MIDVQANSHVDAGQSLWYFSTGCRQLTWEVWCEAFEEPYDAMRWLRSNCPSYRLADVSYMHDAITVPCKEDALRLALRFYWRTEEPRLRNYAEVLEKNLTDALRGEYEQHIYVEGYDERGATDEIIPFIEEVTGVASSRKSKAQIHWEDGRPHIVQKLRDMNKRAETEAALDEIIGELDRLGKPGDPPGVPK